MREKRKREKTEKIFSDRPFNHFDHKIPVNLKLYMRLRNFKAKTDGKREKINVGKEKMREES